MRASPPKAIQKDKDNGNLIKSLFHDRTNQNSQPYAGVLSINQREKENLEAPDQVSASKSLEKMRRS